MKYWHYCIDLGLIAVFSIALATEKSLAALPLQEGVYHGGGSRYIQIAQKANIICFKGFSPNGVTVASVTADPIRQNSYKINGFDGIVLRQQDKDTLFFGPANQLIKYIENSGFSRDLDSDLQQCLNSQKPFFKQKSGGRNAR
ncbi:MAG: hypothetical protein JGK17_08210 [Microcoleus sp. PH2017_10_PVI_O_A]|uniref:hypothetical protein n=1 Tax=unclassified Microcoleus TaxID=2642155 RepID=UPI001DCB417D|nr:MULTISPECIES: hypothetical protein [unclassified Microcoleus]TAE84112.1 MAG: hypothetical protein EAZ83_07750 [Oscillatoriales cyanobacterium]MCC3405563.1 hypothetical protein [Microcoleus sp. PH2017_10_PVI_O_A]MCC3459670.1 hypothetical protein [Microcoleus sp. PH2017_11_PCY_U_A]MCC3478028.1 hypothetical protein [Microcoleus sp. PH2017_12_PCY_D_A]MCC3528016.1 hypothetical protein [Microcoleus sp. PH2017_21_RUC_O_A]